MKGYPTRTFERYVSDRLNAVLRLRQGLWEMDRSKILKEIEEMDALWLKQAAEERERLAKKRTTL